MKKKKQRKHSFILIVAMFAIVLTSAVTLVNKQIDINRLNQEYKDIQIKLSQQKKSNEEVKSILDDGNEDQYVERIAREKFGYVKPDEKVFYDISSSD